MTRAAKSSSKQGVWGGAQKAPRRPKPTNNFGSGCGRVRYAVQQWGYAYFQPTNRIHTTVQEKTEREFSSTLALEKSCDWGRRFGGTAMHNSRHQLDVFRGPKGKPGIIMHAAHTCSHSTLCSSSSVNRLDSNTSAKLSMDPIRALIVFPPRAQDSAARFSAARRLTTFRWNCATCKNVSKRVTCVMQGSPWFSKHRLE